MSRADLARAAALGALLALAPRPGAAEIQVPMELDAGLLLARPAALQTGLSTGVSGGLRLGEALGGLARLGWSSATEYTLTHTVTHHEFRARLGAEAAYRTGPGAVGLRLLCGATAVYERRERAQAERAGLSEAEALDTGLQLVPVGEAAVGYAVHVLDDFGLSLALGPSLTWRDGAHLGFTAELGVAFWP